MEFNTDYALDKEATKELLESEEVYATTVRAILNAAYGEQIYDVDVIEIYMDLESDFDIKLDVETENKINALLFAVTFPSEFFTEEEAFVGVGNSLLGGDVGDEISVMLDDLTVAEMLWALYEVEINLPDGMSIEYSPEVDSVINSVLDSESMESEQEAKIEYQNFLEDHKTRLTVQLTKLGFDKNDIFKLVV
jgi:hypothetical protein